MNLQYYFVRDPWEVTDIVFNIDAWNTNRQDQLVGAWPLFLITEKNIFATGLNNTEAYPSRLINIEGDSYRVTELPGPSTTGDAAFNESFELKKNGVSPHLINLSYSQRYPARNESKDETFAHFDVFFDRILNEMLYIVRHSLKADKPRSITRYWPGVLNDLKSNYDEDPAKHALIVDLAESILQPLDYITSKPKKNLTRIRDQQRIQNVQEIDTKCLIDLCRRPGGTLPEKAGPKQRILAIKRKETIDVLENRVTLHCCKLLGTSALRYLDSHRGISVVDSRRKSIVKSLYRASKRLPGKASFRGVGFLKKPCHYPNYTLLQNLHYAKIWKAYSQLIRNEDLRETIWRWGRRLWADYLGIYLADTILRWFEKLTLPIATEAGEKIIQANGRHYYGKWFLRDVMPGPFILGKDESDNGTLYFYDGDSIEILGEKFTQLSALNADYLFVWFSNRKRLVLPVYANLMPPDTTHKNYHICLKKIAQQVLFSIKKYNDKISDLKSIGAWVLHGNWPDIDIPKGYVTGRELLLCWQSAPPIDPLSWSDIDEHQQLPLNSLVGI
jgi:hypothetical protein